METNAKRVVLALLAGLLTSAYVQAQAPEAPADDNPPVALSGPHDRPGRHFQDGPGGPGMRHGLRKGQPGGPDQRDFGRRGPGRQQGLTSLTTVAGTVGQWIANDDNILDGFTLNTGSATTTVKFPPHLGQQIQKAVKPGASVSVTGYSDTTPMGETHFLLNSLTAGKVTVNHTPPTRPTNPPEPPALVTVTGKIADYRLNRNGRVDGLVLDDKTVVNIPPHVAYQLTNLAKKGSAITVQGYPKTLREGQVQLEKVTILRASVLTINNQQYLVR